MATCMVSVDLFQINCDQQFEGQQLLVIPDGVSNRSSLLHYQYLDRWTVAPGHWHERLLKDTLRLNQRIAVQYNVDETEWKIDIDFNSPEDVPLIEMRSFSCVDTVDHDTYLLFTITQCILTIRDLFIKLRMRLRVSICGVILGATTALPPRATLIE